MEKSITLLTKLTGSIKGYISLKDLYDITTTDNYNITNLIYKSLEYNKMKRNLPCIMPHGRFNGLGNSDLINYSNLYFLDIDGFDTTKAMNDTIERLIDTFNITFIKRSISGKGIHIIVKLNDTFLITNDTIKTTDDTFDNRLNYIISLFLGKGFNIDLSAKGLSRKMILSYDKDCYFNEEVSLDISLGEYENYLKINSNKIKKVVGLNKSNNKGRSITTYDTLDIIPVSTLLSSIKTKTDYNKEIKGDYVIEDLESYNILIPKIIYDGNKHRIYTRIINALYYLNKDITQQQIFSYLFYVNTYAQNKMNILYLNNFVKNICNNIESTGEIRIKTRTKHIHFNIKSNFTKKQKHKMANQLNGITQTNKTIQKIVDSIKRFNDKGDFMYTYQMIADDIGMSLATIKRNYKNAEDKVYQDPSSIEPEDTTYDETFKYKTEMTEDEFFDKRTVQDRYFTKEDEIVKPVEDMKVIEYLYKGYEKVKVTITKYDIEHFKLCIKELKDENKPIDITNLEEYGIDKYKLDILYTKYNNKLKYETKI